VRVAHLFSIRTRSVQLHRGATTPTPRRRHQQGEDVKTEKSMAPPAGDPRRPAEARSHPPSLSSGPRYGDMPDLRSMLATLLAVSAIITKVKAAAWISLLVLLSAASNVRSAAEVGPIIAALPAVAFAFLGCYGALPQAGSGPASPLDALAALFSRVRKA